MEEKSAFSLALKPGLIIGLAAIAVNLTIWALVSDIEQRQYFEWLNYIIMGGGFYYFTVNYRDNVKEGYISYGESFVFILFMSIAMGVLWAVYYYIFLSFIDTSFLQQMLDLVEEKYYEAGMSEEQIEQTMKWVGYIYQPVAMAIMTIFGSIFSGVFLGLIISIFTKKQAPINFDNYQN